MTLFLAALVVVIFSVLLQRLKVLARAREATHQARRTASILRDPILSDRDKERELQRSALRLLLLSTMIAGLSLLALLLPLAGVFALDLLGWTSGAEVLAFLQRGDFLIGAAVVGTASYQLSGAASHR